MDEEQKERWQTYTLRQFYDGLYLPETEYPREKDCQVTFFFRCFNFPVFFKFIFIILQYIILKNLPPEEKAMFLMNHLEGIYNTTGKTGKLLQKVLNSKGQFNKYSYNQMNFITNFTQKICS